MKRIKLQCLRWLGHVDRKDSSNPVRKVFESEPGAGICRKERPSQRCAEQVNKNVTTLGIRNLHQVGIACDVWRRQIVTAKKVR